MLYKHVYSHNIYKYIDNVYLCVHKPQIMSHFYSLIYDRYQMTTYHVSGIVQYIFVE